ncbi:hypothetical protein PF005_g19258 [Phytophthora fragariae]|uniref:M96 mating-specific protein family n=1 Tax=Phytophthora fragariae TaxID=53985 RepID=A0A6A3R6V2_9STRA|nr:hypothetical protein PF003_g22842 [Phytophthora fragariae]KAE8931456.1 hypothetical protein PF009_g18483 [Phytophthora fragariae]KAE8991030.1 hypothetical protein PF011_g18110 [Phytophthora fragariae]KAE9091082.1 hypothetical protein PF007_g19012 [Phytophthora fragariae]KAE9120280.1 hypothetical protein PF006_g18165 [Phytophthora fragariae]
MNDSLLDSLLHHLDDPSNSGNGLLQAFDEDESLLSLQGTDALQMLDVTTISGQFSATEEVSPDHDRDRRTDRYCSAENESVASTSPPMTVENIRSRDTTRRCTYRQKQKAQKDVLYRQVDELTSQLSVLQKRKETAEASKGTWLGHAAVWKVLADRHMKARVLAEEQRRRLCKAVERRSALIQNLGVLLRKRIGEEQPEEAAYAGKKPRTESPDVLLYEAFINELAEVYARTDSIFKETTMEIDVDSQAFFNLSQPTKTDARYHELVGALTTPFAFERVRVLLYKVWWSLDNYRGYETIEGSWIPDDTYITKICIDGPGGNLGSSRKVKVHMRACTQTKLGGPSCDPPRAVGKEMLFTDTVIKIGEDICQRSLQKLEEKLLDDTLGV